ncbi:MAG: hypothetical protein IRY99_10705, partial [Isosphaeraceae bacterium]|nr:hypothetical protein [Isosphaeraceae bacterium]
MAAGPSGAALFVWGTWAVLLLAALALVACYGRNVPHWDDWMFLPVMAGARPVTLAWLWAQYYEHRIPLPKLVLVALYRLSGGDLRAGMYLNVLAMGGLAGALLWAVRRLRGRWTYTDAVFPLALLHGGHAFNFLWCNIVLYTIQVVLLGVLLVVIVLGVPRPMLGGSLLAGLGLVCLPVSQGLPFVPFLALWLGYAGWLHWRSSRPGRRPIALVLWGAMAAGLLLVGAYFIGYHRHIYVPPPARLGDVVRTGLMFLINGYGPIAYAQVSGTGTKTSALPSQWPASTVILSLGLIGVGVLAIEGYRALRGHRRAVGLPMFLGGLSVLMAALAAGRNDYSYWKPWAAVTWGLFLTSIVALAAEGYRSPRQRCRAVGLLMFLGGITALTAALGWCRAAYGYDAGLQPRYPILVAPVFCCLYFALEVCGPRALTRAAQLLLFALLLAAGLLNVRDGVEIGKSLQTCYDAFERDVRCGLPPYRLQARHYAAIFSPFDAQYLPLLQRAGVSCLRDLRADPPFREVPLALPPTALHQATWRAGTVFTTGADSYLEFA